MKTIRAGVAAEPAVAWWVGKVVSCSRCGGQFQIEATDGTYNGLVAHAERHPGGRQWVEIPCPTEGCESTAMAENVAGPELSPHQKREFVPPESRK